jgi:hypothetical protein
MPTALLIVLSLAGTPQFIIAQPSMEICALNARALDGMLNAQAAFAECWDQSVQAFRQREHVRPPEGERID